MAGAGLQVDLRAQLGELVRDRGNHRDPPLVRPGFFEHRNLDWHERPDRTLEGAIVVHRRSYALSALRWATRA